MCVCVYVCKEKNIINSTPSPNLIQNKNFLLESFSCVCICVDVCV